MADEQLLSIALGGGLDESMDDAFTPPTVMRVAKNVVYPTAQSCTKRNGISALATLPNLKRLARHGDEVLAIDGLNVWSWSPAEAALVNRGPISPCVARQLPLGGGAPLLPLFNRLGAQPPVYVAPAASIAEGNGLRVSVYTDGSAILANVYDVANKLFVRQTDILLELALVSITTAYQPRVMVVGTTAIAVFFDYTNGLLRARTLNLTNVAAGWSGLTTLYTGTAATVILFDVSPMPTVGGFAMIIGDTNSGASPQLLGRRFTTALAQIGSDANLNSTVSTMTAVALRAVEADNLFQYAVGYGTNHLALGCITLDFLGVVSNFTSVSTSFGGVQAISLERKYESGSGSSSVFFLAFTWLAAETGSTLTQTRFATSHALIVANVATLSVFDTSYAQQIMSKVFCVSLNGSNQYFFLSMGSDRTAQPTSVLLMYGGNANTGTFPIWLPVATLTPDYAAAIGSSGEGFPTPSAQDVSFAGITNQSVYTIVGTFVAQNNSTAVGMFEIDFASVQAYQAVDLGHSTYIACGTPMVYDGVSLTEAGFTQAPPQPSITCTGSNGSVPINPALTYVLCFAQQDDAGNVHRSEPSTPAVVNNAGVGQVQLYIPPYKMTYRQPPLAPGLGSRHPIIIEVYRNSVATPSVYQLLSVIPNNPDVVLQEFIDTAADSFLAGQPALYTQLGLVPACPWPSMTSLAVHSDRIFGSDADGITTYYTTSLEAGLAPRTADQFTILWPEGPITACWSLEGRLHTATSKRIHFLFGDGPNDNGASSDFSSPQLWQGDLGVVDARAMAICAPGVFFLSEKGIYLETRGGEFQWIGERVQRTLAASGNVVTSMVSLDVFGVVRFTLGGSGTPPVLHYDYRHDRWSTLVYGAPMVSSTVGAGVWYGLGTPGAGTPTLYQESATSYLDGAAWVPVTLTTGWALPGGTSQGWGKVSSTQMVLNQATPFVVSVAFTRDYLPAPDAGSPTWTDAELAAYTGTLPTLQLRPNPPTQYAQALSITLTDAAPTSFSAGTGQGAVYQHFQIAMRPDRGAYPDLNVNAVK